MKIEIEHDDGVMLKKYAHAEICFQSCVDYLELFSKEHVEWTSPKSRALLSAAIIEYGKPFKKSRGIDKIDDAIIPEKYKELHDKLIKSRDKFVAHIDNCGIEETDREFHRIHLIKKGSTIFIDIESPRLPENLISPMKNLSKELREKASYYRQKYLKKYSKKMFDQKGDINWELEVGETFCGLLPVTDSELTEIEWK